MFDRTLTHDSADAASTQVSPCMIRDGLHPTPLTHCKACVRAIACVNFCNYENARRDAPSAPTISIPWHTISNTPSSLHAALTASAAIYLSLPPTSEILVSADITTQRKRWRTHIYAPRIETVEPIEKYGSVPITQLRTLDRE